MDEEQLREMAEAADEWNASPATWKLQSYVNLLIAEVRRLQAENARLRGAMQAAWDDLESDDISGAYAILKNAAAPLIAACRTRP